MKTVTLLQRAAWPGVALAMAAANDLGADAPLFVAGADPRQAGAVADPLGRHGYPRVFVVAL